MNPKRDTVMTLLITLLLLSAAGIAAAPARAQSSEAASPPFTDGATPSGWTWWCSEGDSTCVLLPDEDPGTQRRFLLVTNDVGSVTSALSGWVGGGEVVWKGAVETAGGSFNGQIVTNDSIRGLVGTSDQWAFAAVGPEGGWESTADVYNNVLRGGPDGTTG